MKTLNVVAAIIKKDNKILATKSPKKAKELGRIVRNYDDKVWNDIRYKIMVDAGRKVSLGGNIGEPLLPYVMEMTEADFAVVELSSFQLQLPASYIFRRPHHPAARRARACVPAADCSSFWIARSSCTA